MHRTHTCGELRADQAGKTVTLAGWIHNIRPHGNVTFVDLRDRYGVTQAVLPKDAANLRKETVIKVTGTVRKKDKPNPKLATGEIEISGESYEVLGPSDPVPMDAGMENTDETRLKYRYLDLRRPEMQHKLAFRSLVAQSFRKHLIARDFLEIETPLLMKSTPEGARDYVVPSRIHKHKFYALPQSPQIYKQLLMVSGCDRYFQLPKCLRDEDLRADRQPEFTQVDVEMSFPEVEDIYELGDYVIQNVVKDSVGKTLKIPLPRLTFEESMEKYGIDKPDIRFEMHLTTVTDIVKKSEFKVFSGAETVRALVAPKEFSRKKTDKLTDHVKRYGAKGLAFTVVKSGAFDGGVAKFISEDIQKELIKTTGAKDGETLFFVADKPAIANEALAQLRNLLGKELKLYDPEELAFLWVTDFPLFEWDEDSKDWSPIHHMFTMPRPEHVKYLETDPGKVIAQCYDIVLNGVELASGSIRVNHPDIQRQIMKAMKIPEEEAERKFGFMLEAFRYGAPPHGGFAIGFDRFVAMLEGEIDIREYIAYPKNKSGESPMDGSPSVIDSQQLDELNLSLKK